jgi:metal-dependent HD superfamily phosphatase/phosphodiesterase
VLNRALHLFRLLHRSGLKSSIETDYAMSHKDAEVIIAGGCLLHDLGMSIHRIDHEAFSLFLAADILDVLLEKVYEEPERTVIASEILHAIIGHRKGGRPLTLEAGVVRVADALDMEQGRSRIPFARGSISIHSLSAAAIEDVAIKDGDQRPVLIEITMNNSSGIYQVDSLLKAKLQGSGLEPYVEVVARIDTEAEKRLVPIYRLEI